MIVAGIGCRKGVDAASILAAVDAALLSHDLDRSALSALATTTFKRDEAAIFTAAEQLGLDVIIVDGADETHAALTRSDISLAIAGSPSVSESAALAAAGKNARLLGPRLITGAVTCAIAVNGASA
ncbi:MAG TPA: cobalamin biosynthesis protein [Mesorhizobium sp.]|uniref:cobalamin biosynthesis protein n=1 Tax=Mesorhizobium sp. TaxID=1871066 RepID=UPI002DDD7FC0|nr:cobalamin biosynthesis protein [Mesorhizobium sp.]HEV2504717.1 cobalamin biosynthesis protein [Mesorhizobium sp.]